MEETLKQVSTSCLKIVVFGPESTGKTTLSKQLAAHFQTLWVPEFSRTYALNKLQEGKFLTKEDVMPIAFGQMKLENAASLKINDLLICDTNLLETLVYSKSIYNNFCPNALEKAVQQNHYDLYILTDIDIPWEDDVVRDGGDRKQQYNFFKATLEAYQLPFIKVSGKENERLQLSIHAIEELKKSKK